MYDFMSDQVTILVSASSSQLARGKLAYVAGLGCFFLGWNNTKLGVLPDHMHKAMMFPYTVESTITCEDLSGELFPCDIDDDELNSPGVLFGLTEWNGNLYFLKTVLNYTVLLECNPISAKSRMVAEIDLDGDCINSHFTVMDGVYYIATGETLIQVALLDGQVTTVPLPDLRSCPLPKDWLTGSEIDPDLDLPNYGEYFTNFFMIDHYGYLSLLNFPTLMIRFSLRDPSDFVCLPVNFWQDHAVEYECPIPNAQGMLLYDNFLYILVSDGIYRIPESVLDKELNNYDEFFHEFRTSIY